VVVFAAEHRRREIHVGMAGRAFAVLGRISPSLVDAFLLQSDRAFRKMLENRRTRVTDNLFASMDGPTTSHGEFAHESRRRSLYTWAVLHPLRAIVLLAAATVAGIGLMHVARERS
jgi:hypothetical protein